MVQEATARATKARVKARATKERRMAEEKMKVKEMAGRNYAEIS